MLANNSAKTQEIADNTEDFNDEYLFIDIMPDWRYEEQEDKDDDWLV